jgi:ribosomal protein L34E
MTIGGDKGKKRAFRKTAKQTKVIVRKKKARKMRCAVTKEVLHGVPHGAKKAKLSKLSKTQKRPSVPFGGLLGGKARVLVITETAKVKMGIKKMEEVEIDLRKYVNQMQQRVK